MEDIGAGSGSAHVLAVETNMIRLAKRSRWTIREEEEAREKPTGRVAKIFRGRVQRTRSFARAIQNLVSIVCGWPWYQQSTQV